MLVRNRRTGVVGHVQARLAAHLIELGKVEEVVEEKEKIILPEKIKQTPKKQTPKKQNYKTRALKAEGK